MDLKTVDPLLTTMRSVRARLDLKRPVSLEIVEQCALSAILALARVG